MQPKKKKFIYLSDLHFENQQWIRELAFWKDGIIFFKNRLGEVVSRWTDKNVLAQSEHFQNQFIVQNEVIDTLRHDIREEESKLSKYAEAQPIAIDHHHFEDHSSQRLRMDRQRDIYNDLKKEFFSFLTKTM